MNAGGTPRPRRGMGVFARIEGGFLIFMAVLIALLVVFQILLLGPFYQMIKTREAESAGEQVVRLLDNEDLPERTRELANDLGLTVVVTDEMGMEYCAWKPTARLGLLDNVKRATLRQLFEEVNLAGGKRTMVYDSPYIYQDGSRPKVILCVRIVRTGAGENRMVLIESEITPVDAVQDTLKIQLLCATMVMVMLGLLLSTVLARRIARPIADINESAKALAAGDYAIRFPESGSREVAELGATLNYAAEELSKVESLRRELLANVSHDLRTPLTMIQGYAEVMRDLPGENTPENVQIIIDETRRLTDLVNDLLDLSRLESGAISLERSVFDLTAAIREILGRYDKLADYRFPFSYTAEAWVDADELKISQVVYNLVNNAINFVGEDKTVALSQTLSGDRVRISVTDRGEGIPEDKLQDIWERYYKVDKEHRRAQVGTGLGLSIVKNILDLHGGAYGVLSRLGEGSTFWFELPLAQTAENGYNREESN